LSIFDICGSQYGAVTVGGFFKANTNLKFTKREDRVASRSAPFVCENSDVTYAFRVGAAGDHLNPPQDDDDLSAPFGDSIVSSVLAAVKHFVQSGMPGDSDLSQLFITEYNKLITHYLATEGFAPDLKPVSNLGRLQALVENGALELNISAFDCSLFSRQNEWFLWRTCRSKRSLARHQPPENTSPILFTNSWSILLSTRCSYGITLTQVRLNNWSFALKWSGPD